MQQLFRLTRRRRAGCPAGCAPPAPPSLRGLQSRGACGHRVSGAAAPSLLPGVEILAIELVAQLLFLALVLLRFRRLRAACGGGSGPRLRRRINQLPLPCTASLSRLHSLPIPPSPHLTRCPPAAGSQPRPPAKPGEGAAPWSMGAPPSALPADWGCTVEPAPCSCRAMGLQAVREMTADSGEGLKQRAAFPSRQLLLHAYTGQGSSRDQQTTAPAQSAHRSCPVWVGRPAPRGRPGWRLHSRRFWGGLGRSGGQQCSIRTEQKNRTAIHMPCQTVPPSIALTAPQGTALLHSQAPPAVVGAPAFWLVSFCSCGAAWAPMCSRATSSPSVAGAGRRPGETPRSEQRRSSAAVECRCMRPVSSAGRAPLAACPDPSAAVKSARRAMA